MDHDAPTPPGVNTLPPLPDRQDTPTGPDRFNRGQHRVRTLLTILGVGVLAVVVTQTVSYVRHEAASTGGRLLFGTTHPASAPVVVKPHPIAQPTQVVIAAIGVDAPLVPLAANPDGSIKPPDKFADAGWFEPGPEPGEQGTSVIAGHVDSKTGPAVFYRLRDLKQGDTVVVVGANGDHATYRIDGAEEYAKAAIPRQVYEASASPSLRLITCAGVFDQRIHHYEDNLVVYASLVP